MAYINNLSSNELTVGQREAVEACERLLSEAFHVAFHKVIVLPSFNDARQLHTINFRCERVGKEVRS